jgi:hypothetical protein
MNAKPDATPDAAPDENPGDIPMDAAVVDRIEDARHAVLLVGPDETELVLDVTLLPEGTREGDWLRLGLTSDAGLTEARRTAIEDRIERIRRTRGGGRFG